MKQINDSSQSSLSVCVHLLNIFENMITVLSLTSNKGQFKYLNRWLASSYLRKKGELGLFLPSCPVFDHIKENEI